jgi:hypothetical protein
MQPFFDANARQQTRVLLQNCHAPLTLRVFLKPTAKALQG